MADIEVKILINKDIYDIFQIVLRRSNHNEKDIIENYMLAYMSKQMEQMKSENKNEIFVPKTLFSNTNYHGKANDRIPLWAHKPNQYNHKIIKAYFKLLASSSDVTIYNMELLCSDENTPEMYVPKFKENYASMKYDGAKSHGKVFEDDGRNVKIWSEVESTLLKYKTYFE